MKQKSSGKLRHFLTIIIPVVLFIVINILSFTAFNQNKVQTYQQTKERKISELQRLTIEMDRIIDKKEISSLEPEQVEIIKSAIKEINLQDATFCFLFNNNIELVPQVNELNEEEQQIYCKLACSEQLKHEIYNTENGKHGELKIKTDKGTFDCYWQAIPTENTEFYMIVGMNIDELHENSAVNLCKVMIAILNVLFTFSIYDSLAIREKYKKEN